MKRARRWSYRGHARTLEDANDLMNESLHRNNGNVFAAHDWLCFQWRKYPTEEEQKIGRCAVVLLRVMMTQAERDYADGKIELHELKGAA